MAKNNQLKVSGDKVFYSLQGEGITMGFPAVFLRLHLCNLKCSWCDTWYTWDTQKEEFWQESQNWSLQKTVKKIVNSWKCPNRSVKKRLVVTGGEPLIQQDNLILLLKDLPDWEIEVETNGTIMPKKQLLKKCQFNCSPKLKNSGNPENKRLNPEVLTLFSKLPNAWFKFVVKNAEDLKEVKKITKKYQLPAEKVMIMPEGRTIEEVYSVEKKLTKVIALHHWRVTKRMQLVWFGDKRRA